MMATNRRRGMAVALLAALGVGLGACGGEDEDKAEDSPVVSAPSGATIEVTAKEFSFTPATLTLKAGQPTTIVLKNIGSIEHDLTVDDADFKLKVNSGQTADKELKLDKPGTYKFDCSIAGHKDAGMKGELTVE
jgi:uncharacterized cupredoxin-like copper-binding protein